MLFHSSMHISCLLSFISLKFPYHNPMIISLHALRKYYSQASSACNYGSIDVASNFVRDNFIRFKIKLTCLKKTFLFFPLYIQSQPYGAITGGILRGSRRERLLSKFVENECEKIDRLMELYMR